MGKKRVKSSKGASRSWLWAAVVFPLFLILLFQVGYWFSPISAIPINDIQFVPLNGPFKVNTKLSSGKRIPMYAPESIIEDENKNLYVGLRDGQVVVVRPSSSGLIGEGDMEVLVEGSVHSSSISTEHSHGIPLGMRLRNDILYIMDAHYGLYTLDLVSRKRKVLLKPSDVSPPMKFPNDLDITADGDIIYFTDTSARFTIHELIEEALEGTCTGRLFSYEPAANKLRTVATGLCFANGVQLTENEKTVIVSETTRYRVSWLDVEDGKKKHVLHLPAMPDNVRRNRGGSYWIGASAKHDPKLQLLLSFPFLRQFILGLIPQKYLMRIPNRKHNMLFEVNDDGDVLSSLHDPTGNLTYALSQAIELSDGRLALGSYAAPYLAIADRVEDGN